MIKNKFISISKRLLPIFAVILVFMSIVVPVNAAFYGDDTPITSTLYTAADVRVFMSFVDDMRLVVDVPDVISSYKQYDTYFGDMKYKIIADEDSSISHNYLEASFNNVDFSLIPFIDKKDQVYLEQIGVIVDDFILKYENPEFWHDYLRVQSYADFYCDISFSYYYVVDGKVEYSSYFKSGYFDGTAMVSLLDQDFYDELAEKGVSKKSYVAFTNISVLFFPVESGYMNFTDFYFSTLCTSEADWFGYSAFPDVSHFVLHNGITFNKVVNVGSSGSSGSNTPPSILSISTISDFIVSGVASFMDAPILSSWLSLGDIFGLFLGVFVLLAFIKFLKG